MKKAPLIEAAKPCPFCGGPAIVTRSGEWPEGWVGVGCATQKDGIVCPGYSHALQHKGEASAVAQWNTRHCDGLQIEIDALRETLAHNDKVLMANLTDAMAEAQRG